MVHTYIDSADFIHSKYMMDGQQLRVPVLIWLF